MSDQAQHEARLGPWLRFLRAHAAVTRQLSARLESHAGLTLSDFDVLAQLFHAPDRRLRRVDLARTVLLSASGITRLLDGLERAGWVEKASCASDARVTYAVLTAAGEAKFSEARASHHADIDELFGSRFSDDERAALSELLGRLPMTEPVCESEKT
ncbi:MAG TPA: MarR family transcriptional regulator [Gaiellaceae bacterium]|nr:MarR family transcriptional regulator [Gaiellaceae bacterium]